MPGILEDVADRLQRLEESVESLATEIRNPEVADLEGVPLAENERIWSAGALDLKAATAFSGIRRDQLYGLMRSGELPYSCPGHKRLVPRLWFVRYLASRSKSQEHAEVSR